ncbi:MarR family winged helix-turn-helix transcriptional regulator [Nocardioides yefusunii]|uniref:MarR family winged helix-turn-helix transcriptional regulator n=1 Tax=Nocardioides yefusunii TaxID=2500546 RepID=A0ABW1QZ77_9ACTN|nr:MarR family transcriptional regulator [Nocardioides yefusunii]
MDSRVEHGVDEESGAVEEPGAAGAFRDDLLTDLEQQVVVLVRRARRLIAIRAVRIHPDLAPTSYVALTYVNCNGPVRASAIAEHFSIDKGAVSRQVQLLSDLGLVVREADPDDRRASIISVTQEARDRLEEARRGRRERLREGMEGWQDADLETFVGLLGKYNALLDWVDESGSPVF